MDGIFRLIFWSTGVAISYPVSTGIFLLVICICFVFFKKRTNKPTYKKPLQWEERPQAQPEPEKELPVDEREIMYRNQLANVHSASYYTKSLLNFHEQQLYWQLVKLLKGRYIVSAQVPLGAILGSKSEDAFWATSSKRPDMMLLDKSSFKPIVAIEYHGSGHYMEGGHAELRDEIKKQALLKAGVHYIVLETIDKDTITQALDDIELPYQAAA